MHMRHSKMITFSTVLFLVINIGCLTARDVPTLFVKPTEILEGPDDYEATADTQATFRCHIKHDNNLHLVVSWKHNGQKIDFENKPRFVIHSDYSLTIHNTNELDSGTYTCVAKTQVDEVQASASLIVQDVPNRPRMMGVLCSEKYATVSWMPMGDNRAPILHYKIKYNTSFNPHRWETINQVPRTDTTSTVAMSPWANYTFRVVAVNKIGSSKPSDHSYVCTTLPDVPYKNPDNVKGEGTQPDNLVISWTKMPQLEHNGPGFHYRVYWKQDLVGADYQYREVRNWKTKHITIHDQPPFTRYLIKVVALNDLGEANVASNVVVDYSGEMEPLLAPENVTLKQVLSPTSVILGWNPVPIESVRGHFQGYKLKLWRENRVGHREIQLQGNLTTASLNNLIPSNKYFVQIYACNNQYFGPPSATISFDTSEHVPDGADDKTKNASSESDYYESFHF